MVQSFLELSTSEQIRKVFFVILAIDQIFYWFTGSYIYRYGIIVKTMQLRTFDKAIWKLVKKTRTGLAIRISKRKNEVYIRYRYPIAVLGPLLFVGQIRYPSGSKLFIRVSPVSGLLIAFALGYALFLGDFLKFINALLVIALILYMFYIRLFRKISKIVSIIESKL